MKTAFSGLKNEGYNQMANTKK